MLKTRLEKLEERLAIKNIKSPICCITETDYRFEDKDEEDRFTNDMYEASTAIIPYIEISKENVEQWRNKQNGM